MTTGQFDSPGPLMTRTQQLLKTKAPKKMDLLRLHDATGIPFFWLEKFVAGAFKNPSVNRVEYLYNHLTGQPLNIQ